MIDANIREVIEAGDKLVVSKDGVPLIVEQLEKMTASDLTVLGVEIDLAGSPVTLFDETPLAEYSRRRFNWRSCYSGGYSREIPPALKVLGIAYSIYETIKAGPVVVTENGGML